MIKNKYPLVSIIITTYKRSNMLKRAVDSVINQTYKNVEIIVVDDNNPNTEYRRLTEEVMKSYNNVSNIFYIRHEKNMNGAVARNTGINNSNGEIVSFLDDDDWYMAEKIEKQVEYLMEHPVYRAVYCGINRNGVFLPTKYGDMSFELLSGTNLIYTNTIMMWKDDAIRCGGWDETFRRHQEAAFMLRYFKNGGLIGVVPECLVTFDTTDRSNAAANGKINEEQMNHYLLSYEDMIARCERKRKGSERDIYSYRYRGVFLSYLLRRDFKSAINLWLRMSRKMPFKFNIDLVKYALNRVKSN